MAAGACTGRSVYGMMKKELPWSVAHTVAVVSHEVGSLRSVRPTILSPSS